MDFHNLFTNIPESIVVVSPEYKILACTDQYLQVTMRKREEILGLHFLLEAFPDREVSYENNPVRKSLDKALHSKKVDYLEVIRYDLPKPANEGGGFEERYWEASHTPVLDAENNVLYIIQKTTDVTERELARKSLAMSEEKFRFMADSMPQLVFTTTAAGELTYLNKRWESYTGISIPVLQNSGWHSVIHPDDMESVTQRWMEAVQTETEMQAELRKRDKDGTFRWHLCRSLPMRNKQGEITMWLGSSTDIHDTRLLVQELVESNEQLAQLSDQVEQAYQKAEAERKTLERLIIEAPNFFCLLQGPDHRYELVNAHYQKLFPGRELLHKTVAEALPEVVEQGFIALLDQVYTTGKSYEANETLIKLDQHGTGNLTNIYVNFLYQPIQDEFGNATGILVSGLDVTELVKLRQQLQQSGFSAN